MYIFRLLTVAILVQRWLAIYRPLLMTRLCTLKRQLIVLTCLSLPIITIHVFGLYVIWGGESTCEHSDFEEQMEHFLQAYRILNLTFPLLCFMCMFVFSGALLYSSCKISQVTNLYLFLNIIIN